jgi:hypothetical protein
MRRTIKQAIAGFVILLVAAALWGMSGFHVHDFFEPSLPDDPDELVLFSVDGMALVNGPKDRGPTNGRELLYGYPVLGQVRITDPELRQEVLAAVKADIRAGSQDQNKCFFPRHVLRVTKGHRTTDVVICFQCHSYLLYPDGLGRSDLTPPIDSRSQPLLNKVLTDAGIPLPPTE